MKKILTSKAAKEAGENVAAFIRSGYKELLNDVNVDVKWEDGRYIVWVVAEFKGGAVCNSQQEYEILKAMREFGLHDVFTTCRGGLFNRTFIGYSNYCDKEPKYDSSFVVNALNGISLDNGVFATLVNAEEDPNEDLRIFLQSNARVFEDAVHSIDSTAKNIKRIISPFADMDECWVGPEAEKIPHTGKMTATKEYRITLK